MAIKEFDRTNLKTLRIEIENALSTVAKKHSIALRLGAISYSGEEFHTKLEAVIQSKGDSGLTVKQIQAIKNVKQYGSLYNVSEADLNRLFPQGDRLFKFVGLMPSRPKYPVLGEDVKTGKVFKFNENVLTRMRPLKS